MRKNLVLRVIFIFLIFLGIGFFFLSKTNAQSSSPVVVVTPTPEPCPGGQLNSPEVCKQDTKYGCGTPKDYWVRDYEVEALGKGGERARQFLSWVLTHPSLDNHPTILQIWAMSRNIVYFLLLLVAVLMGIGLVVGQKNNLDLKIEVFPLFIKLALLLLYATFSATLVLFIIQITDIIMRFFIKTLGADQLFNIFFIPSAASGGGLAASEESYRTFYGCSNMNPEHREMYRTSLFLIRFTNMTYYVIGIMLILRKIILWFLLILSPFLAILLPFVFIRNIGWIWIGVFFQWAFYGPLFGLFLGSLARIWNSAQHIPFIFDFSRVEKMKNLTEDWVFPTVIRILYGGPAQALHIRNSANYIDTFAEYVIALIMLWVVILLPWWLLRIFRDYCCEGIYAMKNILLGMYNSLKGGSLPPLTPVSPSPVLTAGMAKKISEEKEVISKIKLETIEEIKKAKTEEIRQVMQLNVRNLTDIARFETNRSYQETVRKNLQYLQNPIKAETPTERQRFMNIRAELFDRALKGDFLAKQTLKAISSSLYKDEIQKKEIVETLPKLTPVVKTVAVKVGMPVEKTSSIIQNIFNSIAGNSNLINQISSLSNVSSQQTQSILNALSSTQNINQPVTTLIENISQKTGVEKEKVKEVIRRTKIVLEKQKETIKEVAQKEGISEEVVGKVIENHMPVIAEPEEHIEETISVPETVSLEQYEEVKSMWVDQYERGEVPVSENIKNREDWLNADIIMITNILNKLMSSDEKMRAEALEQVGYILPLFLINNMKGEELVVYLKAKLEAAKQVKREIEKEKEAKEKVKEEEVKEEVFVKVKAKQEKEKAMEMEEEIEDKQNKEEESQKGGINQA